MLSTASWPAPQNLRNLRVGGSAGQRMRVLTVSRVLLLWLFIADEPDSGWQCQLRYTSVADTQRRKYNSCNGNAAVGSLPRLPNLISSYSTQLCPCSLRTAPYLTNCHSSLPVPEGATYLSRTTCISQQSTSATCDELVLSGPRPPLTADSPPRIAQAF